jgi:hypothetical protein
MSKLDSTRLKEVLSYDSDTGVFTRKTKGHKTKVGCFDPEGYIYIQVDRIKYSAHRLAWLYMYDEFPTDQIDHINGIKNDNRIANLRACTHAENQQTKRNVKGYSWHKSKKRFIAYIKINKKRIELGNYLNEQDARQAYLNGKIKYHSFIAV